MSGLHPPPCDVCELGFTWEVQPVRPGIFWFESWGWTVGAGLLVADTGVALTQARALKRAKKALERARRRHAEEHAEGRRTIRGSEGGAR